MCEKIRDFCEELQRSQERANFIVEQNIVVSGLSECKRCAVLNCICYEDFLQ